MAQLAEWPAVVTCGRTVEEAREMLLDAAREMIASYRDEGGMTPDVRQNPRRGRRVDGG
jgi:predicted RNase H-like HicB family nuclease